MTIHILSDKVSLEHFAGTGHPEQPLRIKKIIDYLNSKGLQKSINSKDIIPKQVLDKILQEIHNQNLIKRVEQSKNRKETYFDQDTQANDQTYNAALKASSLAMTAGKLTSVNKTYFSIMRPPGHHATPNRIMGFCFFNNMALATKNLLETHKKVAIIDFDFHYGNGTADIFWNNPNVLYISIHADPTINFPNQGFIDEIGSKEGKGYNICIPLTVGSGNNEMLYAMQEIVFPILGEFKPGIVGMSAGFDGYYDDPVGGGYLQYDRQGFNKIGKMFYNYSQENKKPIFHVLEGGYNISKLPELVYSYIDPWLKDQPIGTKKIREIPENQVKSREKKTIQYIKQMVNPYWKFR